VSSRFWELVSTPTYYQLVEIQNIQKDDGWALLKVANFGKSHPEQKFAAHKIATKNS